MQIPELIQYFTPAIIVCYFLFSSIINANYKGLVVVAGICLTVAVCLLSSNLFKFTSPDRSDLCNLISINRISGISKIPISIAIYTYVGGYLLYTIGVNSNVLPNVIPFVLYPFIILTDLAWISKNRCFTGNQMMASIIIGTCIGILWGVIINSTKNKSLQYLADGGGNSCLIPKHQTFKCKTKPPSA